MTKNIKNVNVMPHNAARCRNAILRCRNFAFESRFKRENRLRLSIERALCIRLALSLPSAKGMLAGITADGTKIPSDGKKIPSDETKIPSDVLTTPPRGNDASNRIHFFVKL